MQGALSWSVNGGACGWNGWSNHTASHPRSLCHAVLRCRRRGGRRAGVQPARRLCARHATGLSLLLGHSGQGAGSGAGRWVWQELLGPLFPATGGAAASAVLAVQLMPGFCPQALAQILPSSACHPLTSSYTLPTVQAPPRRRRPAAAPPGRAPACASMWSRPQRSPPPGSRAAGAGTRQPRRSARRGAGTWSAHQTCGAATTPG